MGFDDLEIEAIIAEMLVIEDCDSVGNGRRVGDMVLDPEWRLLGFKDVIVEARKSVSTASCKMDWKEIYPTQCHYD